MRVSDNSSDAIMIISSSGSMMAASVETVQLLVFVAVLGPSVVVGDSVTVKVNVVMTVVIRIWVVMVSPIVSLLLWYDSGEKKGAGEGQLQGEEDGSLKESVDVIIVEESSVNKN